ncbi:hypothetical protein F5Y17DRAFT_430404 [Xylariaceae sp. FL0594]|nr:hypothetical protein F5Y17DRAFT_430404 [Xylariaceae sp. FL0594]
MAEAGATMAAYSNVAAIAAAGAAAAAAATTRSRYNNGQNINYPGVGPRHLNSASYMNNLRAPAYTIRPPGSPARGGVGVHLHYQGRCPHASHSSHSDDDTHLDHNRRHGPSYFHVGQPFSEAPYAAAAPTSGYPFSSCGCADCYWRDFLTDDVEKYNITRRLLRDTYLWNLEELVRRHRALPTKQRDAKDNELDKLYWYYVARVREVYENHCRHHRLLFHDTHLAWETPEKAVIREEDVEPAAPTTSRTQSRSRHSSGSSRPLLLMSRSGTQPPTPLSLNENERCLDLAATQVDGGNTKAKGVDRVPDENAPSSARPISIDGERALEDEGDNISSLPLLDNAHDDDKKAAGPAAASTPKANSRYSMTRLRNQLWPNKTREKAASKLGFGQVGNKETGAGAGAADNTASGTDEALADGRKKAVG